MRPGNGAVRREIIGIGEDPARHRLGLLDPVGDAVALGIAGRLIAPRDDTDGASLSVLDFSAVLTSMIHLFREAELDPGFRTIG